MKKSIICLGIALVSFSTFAQASNYNSSVSKEISQSVYEGVTPLCVAISKGEVDFVKKLISYGVDVNQKSNGLTPLMIAARYNKVDIIKLLLANGARAKDQNEIGITALKYAEISNAKDAMVYLKFSQSKKPVAGL
jgi:ankyrin repeat protein